MLLLGLRRLLFAAAALVVTVALLEFSLPLLHDKYAVYFRRSISPAILDAAQAQRFFESGGFDPDLGWDRRPVVHNYTPEKRYLAQSYGDSFVEGAVPQEHTWQAHFENLTGGAILNFGVGGYGLDQAVLKFERYGRDYRTPIALLGLYYQSFRRALSYHSYYYFHKADNFKFAFKPIFIKRDDHFELMRPPCTDAPCLMRLLTNPDHEVWRRLEEHDYWYQHHQNKPASGFPSTIKYAQVMRQVLHERRELRGRENYFFVNDAALDLSKYLVQRFVRHSRDLGMLPVCVMLYAAHELQLIQSGIRLDDELLKFLRAKNIDYVDTAEYILDQHRDNDGFKALILPDTHLNSRGNRMVAEALARGLGARGVLGARKNGREL
jgi:hypothetical protein